MRISMSLRQWGKMTINKSRPDQMGSTHRAAQTNRTNTATKSMRHQSLSCRRSLQSALSPSLEQQWNTNTDEINMVECNQMS